jgi:hypothetical protein
VTSWCFEGSVVVSYMALPDSGSLCCGNVEWRPAF